MPAEETKSIETIKDFNLLVSTARRHERRGRAELTRLLREIGDLESQVEFTDISGILTAKTELNPFTVISTFRQLIDEKPYEFRYVLKVIPIEIIVPTNLQAIQKGVMNLREKIEKNETFRVTVVKRHSPLSTMEIIQQVASTIQNVVKLDNPDKIVLIEILGLITGISVVSPKEILSIFKEKILD